MAIYDEKKMQQLPVYPTKQTPSYSDWNLFEMGKELEQKVDESAVVPEPEVTDAGKVVKVNEQGEYALAEDDVGTRLMAGTGIEIVSDTINNTAPVPAYTTSDDGKILGVTVDSSGETPVAEVEWIDKPSDLPVIASGDAGKSIIVNSNETGYILSKIYPGFEPVTNFTNVGTSNESVTVPVVANYDYIMYFEPIYYNNDDRGYSFSISPEVKDIISTGVTIKIKNRSGSTSTGHIGNIRCLRRPKIKTTATAFIIGYNYTSNSSILPTLGTAGQVLAVNSGASGVEWITPSSGGDSGIIYVGNVSSAGTHHSTVTNFNNLLANVYDTYKDGEHAIILVPLNTGSRNYYITYGYRIDDGISEVSFKDVNCYAYNSDSLQLYTGAAYVTFLIFKINPTSDFTVNGIYCTGLNFQPKMSDCKELPHNLGYAGQVLTVNSTATGVEWITPSGGGGGSGVQAHTYSDWGNVYSDLMSHKSAIVKLYFSDTNSWFTADCVFDTDSVMITGVFMYAISTSSKMSLMRIYVGSLDGTAYGGNPHDVSISMINLSDGTKTDTPGVKIPISAIVLYY